LGEEALRPFHAQEDKGIIVLCKTSNPGSGEFQNLVVLPDPFDVTDMCARRLPMSRYPGLVPLVPLYRYVAYAVATRWNHHRNCGLVVGATYPEELARVRGIVGDMPILLPGIGAQGGDVEATVRAGKRHMIINSSSGIIFAEDPRAATQQLHDQITSVLSGAP
jgi:orotidine-5'-phosphate decarboxylase